MYKKQIVEVNKFVTTNLHILEMNCILSSTKVDISRDIG